MNFTTTFAIAAASEGAKFTTGTASLICFIIGCILLVLSIVFFFVFNIPSVFLLRTGKGARQTIKKMREINAETGRLRKNKNEYMLSPDYTSGEMTASLPQQNDTQQSATNEGENATTVLSADGENATTVLSPVETTILANNETTVLSGEITSEVSRVEYIRETSGRFDIVYNLMFVHSDETI